MHTRCARSGAFARRFSSSLRGGVGWDLALDRDDQPVVLLRNAYWIDELRKRFPDLRFAETSGAVTT